MSTVFYDETDWESSSGPILSRQVALGDIWPVGANSCSDGVTDKDDLENGLHPCVAVGAKALRGANSTGVVITFEGDTTEGLVQLNMAPGFMFKAYVANVLTYNAGAPNTFDQSLAIGDLVYVDDSNDLAAGVTLSRSSLNDLGSANPKAGMIWYNQDEYDDSFVGGLHASAGLPIAVANSLAYTLVTVMLWPENA